MFDVNIVGENINIDECQDELFNSPISDKEILEAVKCLNPSKANSGVLLAKHFIYSIDIILPFVNIILNKIFSTGYFPPNGRAL